MGREEDLLYFSVKFSTNIGGSNFRPSVCYPIPESLHIAIIGMAEKGLAKLYTEEVRFVSGVALPVKVTIAQPEQQQPSLGFSPLPQPPVVTAQPVAPSGKKRGKKAEFS
jgi:hypothetical protein